MVLTTVFNRPSRGSQTFWEMAEARRVIQLSGWSIVQSQQIYPGLRAAGEGKNTNLKSKANFGQHPQNAQVQLLEITLEYIIQILSFPDMDLCVQAAL